MLVARIGKYLLIFEKNTIRIYIRKLFRKKTVCALAYEDPVDAKTDFLFLLLMFMSEKDKGKVIKEFLRRVKDEGRKAWRIQG